MLKAQLIIIPQLDRGSLCTVAESVTGRNHLRATDAKNLKTETAEHLSILEDFGGQAEDGRHLLYFGYVFSGTYPLVYRVCSILNSPFLASAYKISDLFASAIVVASYETWLHTSLRHYSYELPIAQVFEKILTDINKLVPLTSNKTLRLN